MKPPVIWDTDVTSLSIRQQLPRPLKHKLAGTKPVMTFVTFGELVSWVKLRDLGRQKTGVIYSWLDKTPFLPGDEAVANAYGRLAAAAKRRGRRRPDNDTWIAARCLTKRMPLATLNVKDFHDFSVHHGLELITA